VTRFLHIADVHLGIRRYRSDERTQDFYRAWITCLEKYAIAEHVDFVLIVGDFFDSRRVDPQAMNHAIAGLDLLRNAGIPVFAIEGNHDQHEATSSFSWLRSLSQWGYLKLLEPTYIEGRAQFSPWNEDERRGGYIDLKGVRVFGSSWYGATGPEMIPSLVDTLRDLRSESLLNVLMLHTDVEGQLSRPIPAISVSKLVEFRSVIDYLALGHTHKNFELGGWMFNPGSLEACNVDEFDYQRGAYLVEVNGREAKARLVNGHYQRPAFRFQIEIDSSTLPDQVEELLFTTLREKLSSSTSEVAPIIEVMINGTLGFEPSLLDTSRIRERVRSDFGASIALVRNKALPVEYVVASGLNEQLGRAERELRVIEELITRDARYREHPRAMADLVLEVKRMALSDDTEANIVSTIEVHSAELAIKS
jgi:DNA repair exonuclease SbcCD nuclease subunit